MHLEQVPITPLSAKPVDWLIGKLDWGSTLRSWIPTGFERYTRILHPAYIRVGKEWSAREVPVPWSIVSEWSGKPLHALSHIQDLRSALTATTGEDEEKGAWNLVRENWR